MKLLVSPINIEEAKAAYNGGADIIDVKNPKEGSLGANFPWVIRSVKEAMGKTPVSATIGDMNYKPGTASLAALGAAVAGADYVKVGLFDIQTTEQAIDMVEHVVKSVKDYDPGKKVVISGYADYKRIYGADVAMMDTGIKDGRSTFEFMTNEELSQFVESAHDLGLVTAIAGNIKFEDIETINQIGPDIIGIRGCVCGGDRNSTIQQKLVEELRSMMS